MMPESSDTVSISPKMRLLGLIGLGLVGTSLSQRLIAAGFEVVGFDVQDESRSRFAALGGKPAHDAAEVARHCRSILLSLPDGEIVARVIDELTPALKAESLVIDTTTAAPEQSERSGDRLAKIGVGYLDATLSGSSEVIAAGQAAWLVGGSDENFRNAMPIFEAVGGMVHHLGPVGAGSRAKLVSNLILGLNRAVLAEGLALAEAWGLDAEATLAMLKSTAAYSKAMDAKGLKMIRRDYRPQALLKQHHKDVRLMLDAATATGQRLPLSELHDRLLSLVEEAGFGDADNAAIIEAWRVVSRQDKPRE
jgi:3-hydroxyisobutyrate dehydrogenase-like beta-hydroxyacid dehydrogenase